MASTIAGNNNASLLTLPLDLLSHITEKLEPHDEKALKLTCKRMNLLIVRPPAPLNFLAVGVGRDFIPGSGRLTPLPQSPLPFKAAQTLEEVELENREVEERELQRGMELSDMEGGDDDEEEDDDDDDIYNSSNNNKNLSRGMGRLTLESHGKQNKFKGKNILNWTAELDSRPGSPSVMSPRVGPYMQSPRASSPAPGGLPSFKLTTQ